MWRRSEAWHVILWDGRFTVVVSGEEVVVEVERTQTDLWCRQGCGTEYLFQFPGGLQHEKVCQRALVMLLDVLGLIQASLIHFVVSHHIAAVQVFFFFLLLLLLLLSESVGFFVIIVVKENVRLVPLLVAARLVSTLVVPRLWWCW